MKDCFLCPRHREWLTENTERLNYYWLSWMDASEYYLHSHQAMQAIPYIGAAFELAECALSLKHPDSASSIQRFIHNGRLLLLAYSRLGDIEAGAIVATRTRQRLERELSISHENEAVRSGLQHFSMSTELGSFSSKVDIMGYT